MTTSKSPQVRGAIYEIIKHTDWPSPEDGEVDEILVLLASEIEKAIKDATQPYHYTMPIKSVRSRNTAFKLYAVKFMNSKLKERQERLLAQLDKQGAK